jgi:hypothetical protein
MDIGFVDRVAGRLPFEGAADLDTADIPGSAVVLCLLGLGLGDEEGERDALTDFEGVGDFDFDRDPDRETDGVAERECDPEPDRARLDVSFRFRLGADAPERFCFTPKDLGLAFFGADGERLALRAFCFLLTR